MEQLFGQVHGSKMVQGQQVPHKQVQVHDKIQVQQVLHKQM